MRQEGAKLAEAAGPESAPPLGRRVVLGRRQAVGLMLLLAVPALAVTRFLGDRVEHLTVRQGEWVLNADVPACARDGNRMQILVRLARTNARGDAPQPRVQISEDYLSRFTDVNGRPSVFAATAEPKRADAAAPVIVELTPDRCGWARGRLAVMTETGERLELPVKTFVFP